MDGSPGDESAFRSVSRVEEALYNGLTIPTVQHVREKRREKQHSRLDFNAGVPSITSK
jgi:hypothetical protein